ncbi:MAG TPA: phosphotransferase [Actinomycetes bacterium]
MEEVLSDSPSGRRIVRLGDTVRRPVYPWSPTIHRLLAHLEAVGFERSPRFLGIDEQGREVLSYLEGTSGGDGVRDSPARGADVWAMVVPPKGLRAFAELIRDYHEAVSGFRLLDATWSSGEQMAEGQIVCHGDAAPWNVVWRDDKLVGLIDFDHARPGAPIDDVAYALRYIAPFYDDDECLRWLRFQDPPNRRERIRTFVRAYGLDDKNDWLAHGLRMMHRTREVCVGLADRGIQPQADWVSRGWLQRDRLEEQWVVEHFAAMPDVANDARD